jgi:hypothetical protein
LGKSRDLLPDNESKEGSYLDRYIDIRGAKISREKSQAQELPQVQKEGDKTDLGSFGTAKRKRK